MKFRNQQYVCRCSEARRNPAKPDWNIGLRILGTEYSVPLKSISYITTIVNGIAKTELNQVYYNPFDNYLEVEYFMPISERVCFTEFKAIYEGVETSGLIKEKEKAKQEYEKHKAKGDVVAYSEINEKAMDIMKFALGNIEPNKSITIKLSYIEDLDVCSSNKFWKHVVYSIVRPRYSLPSEKSGISREIGKLSAVPVRDCDHPPYTWEITTKISHSSKIDFVKSTSHEISVETTDEFTIVRLDPQNKKNAPTKDFILLFRDEKINKPQVVLGRSISDSGTRYSANITFVPNFSNLSADDAFKAQLSNSNTEEFDIDFESARGEYIFFLDRSGSMSGHRIDTAKNALILFLKSLPLESFYNVYSFGSSYELLHKSSEKVSDVQLTNDIEKIKLFGANLGGTEILEPFLALTKVPSKKGYPRQIFLLTDGDVSNTDSVLEAISQESKLSRIHTIGIGSGASAKLIKEGARRGKGSSLMLADNEDISGKIIDLLQKSLTPCLDKFEFKFDKNLIDIVAPNPENISAILKNEPFNMTLFLKPKTNYPFKTEVRLKCFDSFSKTTLEYVINIDSENCKFHESVYKYGCHRYINDLLLSSKSKRDFSSDIFIARKIDLESEVVELSIKEQILCEKTAFICVIKEATDSMKIEMQNKGQMKFVVPSIVRAENLFEISNKEESLPVFKTSWVSQSNSSQSAFPIQAQGRRRSPPPSNSSENTMVDRKMPISCAYQAPIEKQLVQDSLSYDLARSTQSSSKSSEKSKSFLTKAKDAITGLFDSKPSRNKNASVQNKESESLEKDKKVPSFASKGRMTMDFIRPAKVAFPGDSEEIECEEDEYFEKNKKAKMVVKEENECRAKKSEYGSGPSSRRDFLPVITLQKPNGLWEAEEKLFNALVLEKYLVEGLISKEIKEKITNESELLNYFITIVVLAWLHKYCDDKKSNWKLIEKKSKQFLDSKLKNELSLDWESILSSLLNYI